MTPQEIRQRAANYYAELNPETVGEFATIDFAAKFASKELGLQRAEEEAFEIIQWIRTSKLSFGDFRLASAINQDRLDDFDGGWLMCIPTIGFTHKPYGHFVSILFSYGIHGPMPKLGENMVFVYTFKKYGA